MPKFLESKLRGQAAKKGLKGKRAARYVYGAMNSIGAMKGNKQTAKGAAMQKKHDARYQTEAHAYDFRQRFGGRKKKS